MLFLETCREIKQTLEQFIFTVCFVTTFDAFQIGHQPQKLMPHNAFCLSYKKNNNF